MLENDLAIEGEFISEATMCDDWGWSELLNSFESKKKLIQMLHLQLLIIQTTLCMYVYI